MKSQKNYKILAICTEKTILDMILERIFQHAEEVTFDDKSIKGIDAFYQVVEDITSPEIVAIYDSRRFKTCTLVFRSAHIFRRFDFSQDTPLSHFKLSIRKKGGGKTFIKTYDFIVKYKLIW